MVHSHGTFSSGAISTCPQQVLLPPVPLLCCPHDSVRARCEALLLVPLRRAYRIFGSSAWRRQQPIAVQVHPLQFDAGKVALLCCVLIHAYKASLTFRPCCFVVTGGQSIGFLRIVGGFCHSIAHVPTCVNLWKLRDGHRLLKVP